MYKSIVLSVLASTAIAAHHYPALLSSRQTEQLPCSSQGEKDCGDGCIPLTYTCCPDGSGGCDLTTVCWLGDNGEYGCCPIGSTCAGPGGVSTSPGETFTSTITEPGETSTFTEPPAETTSSESSTSISVPTEEPTTSLSTPSVSIPSSTESTSTPTLTPSPTTTLSTTSTTPTSTFVTAAAPDTYRTGAFIKAVGGIVLGALIV